MLLARGSKRGCDQSKGQLTTHIFRSCNANIPLKSHSSLSKKIVDSSLSSDNARCDHSLSSITWVWLPVYPTSSQSFRLSAYNQMQFVFRRSARTFDAAQMSLAEEPSDSACSSKPFSCRCQSQCQVSREAYEGRALRRSAGPSTCHSQSTDEI